jgi:hypothetical protein
MTRVSTGPKCWRGLSTSFCLVIIQDSHTTGGWGASCRWKANVSGNNVLEFCFLGIFKGRCWECLPWLSWDSQWCHCDELLVERFELPRATPFSSPSDTAVRQCHVHVPGCIRFYGRRKKCVLTSFISWHWHLVPLVQ